MVSVIKSKWRIGGIGGGRSIASRLESMPVGVKERVVLRIVWGGIGGRGRRYAIGR